MLESLFHRVDGGPLGKIVPPTPRSVEVIDGDGIKRDGVSCRLAGYDAPELFRPRSTTNPHLEMVRGYKATYRLTVLLARAKAVEVELVKLRGGGFGRDLVRLRLDGEDISDIAIREEWGREWRKGQHIDWGDARLEFPDDLPVPASVAEHLGPRPSAAPVNGALESVRPASSGHLMRDSARGSRRYSKRRGWILGKSRTIFVSHAYRDADLYHDLIRVLRERGHFSFQDASIPDISLIDSNKSKVAIRNRIKRCDVMLVFTRPVATKSVYIQYELQTARELNKPIIGIRPIGDKNVSRVVRHWASLVIDWDVEEFVRQIRNPGAEPLAASATFVEVDDLANAELHPHSDALDVLAMEAG
jgi:antiphage defense system Thoeris ThsB-like protein